MEQITGFQFSENDARVIVEKLDKCARLMDESVAYAIKNCPEEVVKPFKQHIATILADLGWGILEQGFYKRYPNLRPTDSSLWKSE